MKVLYNSRGQSVNIEAEQSLTIAGLKSQLQDTCGVSPQYQEIFLNGKKLHNSHTLSHYNLTNESAIELHVHLNGGCSEWCSCCGCSEGCSCTIL